MEAFQNAYASLNARFPPEIELKCFEHYLQATDTYAQGRDLHTLAGIIVYLYGKHACHLSIEREQLNLYLDQYQISRRGMTRLMTRLQHEMVVPRQCKSHELVVVYLRRFCKDYPKYNRYLQFAETLALNGAKDLLIGCDRKAKAAAILYYTIRLHDQVEELPVAEQLFVSQKQLALEWQITEPTLRHRYRQLAEALAPFPLNP